MRNYLILLIVVSIVLSSCRKKAIKVDFAFQGGWFGVNLNISEDFPVTIEINEKGWAKYSTIGREDKFKTKNWGFARIFKDDLLQIGDISFRIVQYPTYVGDTNVFFDYYGRALVFNYEMKLDDKTFFKYE